MPSRFSNIGWTIAATVLLAVALSLAPVPDDFKPFPSLRDKPRETVLAALTPPSPKKEVVAPTVDWEAEAAQQQPVELEMEPVIEEPVRPVRKAVAPAKRTKEDEADARRWEVIIRKVQAAHVSIIDNCLDETCSTTALTSFFNSLSALRSDEPMPVRVVTIGTSLIASDHITDTTRRLLQARHGSGGLGFMFVDRPTRGAGRTVRNGVASEGWLIEKITDEVPFAQAGFTGAGFTAKEPQFTKYDVAGLRRAELFLVRQPGGGSIELLADGQSVKRIDASASRRSPSFERVLLPQDTRELLLRTRGNVRLDGVAIESELPGVTLDSLGLPGASAQVLLKEDEALFAAQLEARSPSLVVLMIGGNDAFDISQGRYDAAKAKGWMKQLIDRVKRAVPEASCLLASPPDAGVWRMDDTIAPRKQTQEVAAYMRELAKENGCALWDMQAAMGGEGAVSRWWDAGLMNHDLVHPLALGGDVLGYLFESALERARQAHVRRHGRAPSEKATPAVRGKAPVPRAPPSVPKLDEDVRLENAEALTGFYEKLKELETLHTGRVAIAQIGASHTAAHFFTDEARRILAERFGSAGRGFIAAGKSSPRLEAWGVKRELLGTWSVNDAIEQKTSGLPWGLTGIRAVGAPDAELKMSFREPLGSDDDTAHLQLHYWQGPDEPPPVVLIDDVEVPISPGIPGPRVVDFAAPGSAHDISVINPGPGELPVFGISHELMKPGIVYDALGLPGSTAAVFASYDQEALAVQLHARQPDLFVFFFGTNESALPPAHIEEMRTAYVQIFATVRRVNPDAACLVLAPTDRMEVRKRVWHEASSINEVVEAMRQIARENNCAFWDTRSYMGGAGAIDVWRRHELAMKDRVHLTPAGYRKTASAFINELLRDYDAWRTP